MLNVREIILKEKILAMKDLPTLTGNIIELVRILSSEDIDMNKVLELVKKDPVLVIKMLKIVNSSIYGLPRKVESVEMIVSLLGTKKIRDIILTASVMDVINNVNDSLWNHSFSTSILVSEIINKEKIAVSPGFTIAALVHDIGQIVLSLFNSKGASMARKIMEEENIPLHEAEKQVIGVDHALVGSWLLEIWGLDESLIYPVAYHHNNEEVNEKYVKEIALLQFADFIEEDSRGEICYPPLEALLECAGLEYLDVQYWAERYKEILSNE
jgi:HD-like signal output (HDOD) protein